MQVLGAAAVRDLTGSKPQDPANAAPGQLYLGFGVYHGHARGWYNLGTAPTLEQWDSVYGIVTFSP